MRPVLCHYHVFKNSGTSFDQILTRSFGDRHVTFDGPFGFSKTNQDELLQIIENTKCDAVSSHQIKLPVPSSLDIEVIPVAFVRHPVFRLRSIYKFSRKSPESSLASRVQGVNDFREWVVEALQIPGLRQLLSNQQARLFSAVYGRPGLARKGQDGRFEHDINQALRNLDSVALLGRTEFFDVDVKRFNSPLESYGISLDLTDVDGAAANVTASDLNLGFDQRLNNLREELGRELLDQLIELNHQDMVLFDYACSRLD